MSESNTESAAKTHTNPLTPYEQEFAELVIKPKALMVFQEAREKNEEVNGLADFCKRWEALHEKQLSTSAAKKWLGLINISFTRRTTVSGVAI